MCGICGIVGLGGQPVLEADVRRMMQSLEHRGPDDAGLFAEGSAGFGHTRLSIIDLSAAGHQPLFSPDDRYLIVYNGEVYNFVELRAELRDHYTFHSETDTEVVLAAYLRWGEACLDRLNGMFAFAIFDRAEQSLFAARDRYGIKPFYYFADAERFVFASEIPAVLDAAAVSRAPNRRLIFDYLAFNRIDHTEQTFFAGINKLPHGHYAIVRDGTVSIRRWYDLRERLHEPFRSPADFRDTLADSVRLRLRSDVPVGACLSGGLDSSSIVSLMLRNNDPASVCTFSATYGRGREGDESRFIELFADTVGKMYFVTPTEVELWDDLDAFVAAHAEPVPTMSPYTQFKVMQLASGHVKVILDGQGADELLAGYLYFFGFLFKERIAGAQFLRLTREIATYLWRHRSLYGLKTAGFFLLPGSRKAAARTLRRRYVQPGLFEEFAGVPGIADDLYGAVSVSDALLRHFEFKLEHLLKWEDRNSMHFSIEARVPFLDHRLVERGLATPSGQVISEGQTKRILREAMRGVLPETIRRRSDKVGFPGPSANWLRGERGRRLVHELFAPGAMLSRDYVSPQEALRLLERGTSHAAEIPADLWKCVSLELWMRKFVAGQ